ncbi:N-acetylmuramoyl-L-alanine amidase family protein [Mangrovibacterium lignilyticum]|uniref:N-acetylmuramoyl-L-alanine amidase family protein n=1 Tax=Mangrovibacterium lignilyticum TaxID=2668052 RepID=UPI0013D1129B|nr:N-acetylmuramoyl-L-alanine amidase [Mangrovibacterium lignilyticum]
MINRSWLALLILLTFCCVTNNLNAKNLNGKSFKIVIDPGHGGHDPGAIYQNIREKDIVLKLALKLGKQIEQEMPDVKIEYTRSTDIFIPLHERAEKAINSKADLFLSLHANSCPTPSVSGTETFVLGMHKTEENLEVAKKENAVILIEDDYSTRYEGFDPNSSESYIMFDLVQEEYFDQSVSMAALVQGKFKNQALRRDRGVKQAGFLVLRQTSMPSILIEAGYLSNADEAAYLNSANGQEQLAIAICDAVKSYKAGFETRNGFELHDLVVEEQLASEKANEEDSKEKTVEKVNKKLAISTELKKTNSIVEKQRPKELYYSIQIAVAGKKLDTKPYNFRGLKSIYMVEHNGVYKYYYAKEQSYNDVLKRKSEAQQHYNDAFVTAFCDGKQISIEEARNLQSP